MASEHPPTPTLSFIFPSTSLQLPFLFTNPQIVLHLPFLFTSPAFHPAVSLQSPHPPLSGQAFTVELDDPSGGSFVDPYHEGQLDPQVVVHRYKRTREQTEALGLVVDAESDPPAADVTDPHHGPAPRGAVAAHRGLVKMEGASAVAVLDKYAAPEEIIVLPGRCAACLGEADTRMF